MARVRWCQPCLGAKDDVWDVYLRLFPPAEAEKIETLRRQLKERKRYMYITRGPGNEVLAGSIVWPFDTFAWLSYLFVNDKYQSHGIGSKHALKFSEIVQRDFPRCRLGIFFEIESPEQSGIDAATKELRRKRRQFYERLGTGCIPVDMPHKLPVYDDLEPIPSQVRWFKGPEPVVLNRDLPHVLLTTYKALYDMNPDHPLMLENLRPFQAGQ